MLKYILLLLIPHVCWASTPPRRPRCRYGDPCWPDWQTWQKFNNSISGRLVRTFPSAAVCHQEHFDAEGCKQARQEWDNSFWRTNQSGAYTAIVWELGNQQCFIDSSSTTPCQPGFVPHYSVAATTVADIEAAIKFANEKHLYLVVKNTGHDHLGRSSGRGSFSIWTHNLKGRQWTDSYIVEGAPAGSHGVPAVTLQAGEQWLDVYRAASEQRVIVVGGHARTVGAAGGWLTGGGHSAWSNLYGLGVDNVLDVKLVNAQGKHVTVNQYTDADYFYALRGGGGSAWGVITSVTYRTHPEPTHIQVAAIQINATTNSTLRPVLEGSLGALVNMTDAGYTGYGYLTNGFSGLFIRPGGTEAELSEGSTAFQRLGQIDGANFAMVTFSFPRWIDYCNVFLQDPNIAMNVMDSSRLLTPDMAFNKSGEIIDMMLEFGPEHYPSFNFIGHVNSATRDNTSVHPSWRDGRAIMSFGTNWEDEAPETEKHQKRLQLVEMSKRWTKIAGPDAGTYVNEANPFEPNWQRVFWGSNYDRLLKVKEARDPTNLFVCNRCVGSDVVYEA
ncbi:oxidoreductase [Cladophialophora psammophila CBS 110553]|uniref:Oxidoreductase n=1 Tax=Cladophialophora psammophila CBS 110553 TaxID=1182543 RepID=W9WM23_9EURO|nr:oxidoreductase [Cladophialophora psammophila CBS 110553]EXJ69227.1 oxidoreductase [Cladophialophora psammophila CBS 110553]